MADNPPVLRIPVGVDEGAPELNRRCSQLSESTVRIAEQLVERQTTSERGLYAQVADNVTEYGSGAYVGPLLPASDYTAGDFFLLTQNGRFATTLPELSGLDAADGDRITSDGTMWVLRTASNAYLSRLEDDTAEGLITFAAGAQSSQPPVQAEDLTRRDYVDGLIVTHEAAPDPHPQYLQSIATEDFARLSAGNVFSSGGRDGQVIRSDGPTGRPGVIIEDSFAVKAAEFYLNEEAADDRVNIIAYPNPRTGKRRMLFFQNGSLSNGALGSVGVGDDLVIEQFDKGPGVVIVEKDVWIKNEVSLAQIGEDIRNGRYARTDRSNQFDAYPQIVRSTGADQRPTIVIEKSDGTPTWEASYNEATDKVNVLAYAGRVYQIQAGAAAGCSVGNPTYQPLSGELSVEGKAYAENQELLRVDNGLTWLAVKGVAVQFNGSLTIAHSYNVTGVTSQGAGIYRVQATQGTIGGQPIADVLLPAVEVVAPDAAGESVFARFQPGAPAGFIDVYCFTLAISGQNLFDTDYTLGANDIVWVNGLMNVQIGTASPVSA